VSEGRRWVKDLIPLLSALLLTYAGWALIQELRMPPPTTVFAPAIPAAPMLPIASPIAVNFPSEMVMVVITPTAEATPEPTPTYIMSTVPPALVCGEWVTRGSVCEMPPMPNTPTPIPPKCPTTEGEDCIWTGRKSDATPVAPTPIDMSDSRSYP
jgi:hypothetical protein